MAQRRMWYQTRVSRSELSQLPAVHEVASSVVDASIPQATAVLAARQLVAERRRRVLAGQTLVDTEHLTSPASVRQRAQQLLAPTLRRVINASGVILHTNLGRAPLSAAAIAAIAEIASGYCNLEFDLATGSRGSRHSHLDSILSELTGASAALAVNNNAAATVLGIAAIVDAAASRHGGREVIVSRGELIEIGGAFRMPEICAMSGARLIAVGTTNKTRIDDYRRAIGPATALLLKVHPSNFAQSGFVEEVSLRDLHALGAASKLPVMMDLGSGCLLPLATQRRYGLPIEPTVAETVALADLVSFSGDKLLGGPQAGILIGRSELVEAARKHPWMRALRPDKLTVAALWATLHAYRCDNAVSVPIVAMLSQTSTDVMKRAEKLVVGLHGRLPGWSVTTIEVATLVGGGTMPTAQLPSVAVKVSRSNGGGCASTMARLLTGTVPVITRLVDDAITLDMRTVLDDDVLSIVDALILATDET
jgi:L-seryl-tRNA(Ser) seleniumtransferase